MEQQEEKEPVVHDEPGGAEEVVTPTAAAVQHVEKEGAKDYSKIPCPFPKCHWGAACKYDHGQVQTTAGSGGSGGGVQKSQYCGHYLKGKCFYGSDCRYEHPEIDFRQKKKLMVLCRHYLTAIENGDKRGCTFGNNCRYLHQEVLPEVVLESASVSPPSPPEAKELVVSGDNDSDDKPKKKKRRKKKKKKTTSRLPGMDDGRIDGIVSAPSSPPSLMMGYDSDGSEDIRHQLDRLEREWSDHFPDPSPNPFMDSLSEKMQLKFDSVKRMLNERGATIVT